MRRGSRHVTVGYAPPPPATAPDYPEYAALRRLAGGAFIPPNWQSRLNDAVARRGRDWASSVVGYHWNGGRHSATDTILILLADERDVVPSIPDWLREANAEHERRQAAARAEREEEARQVAAREQQRDAEWRALKDAFPVGIVAAHNYRSRRHLENFVQGVDHIIVQADLSHGRLRREARRALCETPSNAHNLHFPYAWRVDQDNATRLPECKTCIRIAERVTGLQAPTLLEEHR